MNYFHQIFYGDKNICVKLFILRRITVTPIAMPSCLWGIFLANNAANGAITMPPNISERIMLHSSSGSNMKKVIETKIVWKNSAKFTDPIASLGLMFSSSTKLDVVIGAHSLLPIAFKKLATSPINDNFFDDIFCLTSYNNIVFL